MKNKLHSINLLRRSQSGFTLVELMLVLVILAILAGIVLPKFSGVSERGRVTAAQTQISTFKTALDAFEVDMGHYPSGHNGLLDLIVRPGDNAALAHDQCPDRHLAVFERPRGLFHRLAHVRQIPLRCGVRHGWGDLR